MDKFYHVTPVYNLESISLNGIEQDIKQAKTNMMGGRLSDVGYIYAFDNYYDAILWAARLGWNNPNIEMAIIQYKDDKPYKKDTHFESGSALGGWLKRKGTVRPHQIIDIIYLTDDMTKEAVKERDRVYSGLKNGR